MKIYFTDPIDKKKMFPNRIIVALLTLAVLFLFSCKKKPFNYRNKYVGNWTFSFITRDVSLGRIPQQIDQSGIYEGKIYYDGKNDGKDIIHIDFAPDWSSKFSLSKSGNISTCVDLGKFLNSNTVSFINTSESCHLRLGGDRSYTVTGTR